MKTLTRTIFLLLIATAWLTTAQEAVAKSKYESVTQKRTETFTGRTDDCTVEVENRYGSVTIENNGTRGEVIVEVSVQIEGRDIFVKDVSEQNDYPKQININGKRPDRITVKNEMQEYVETTFTTEKVGHTHIGTLQRPMDFDGNKVTVHIKVRMPKGMNAIERRQFQGHIGKCQICRHHHKECRDCRSPTDVCRHEYRRHNIAHRRHEVFHMQFL